MKKIYLSVFLAALLFCNCTTKEVTEMPNHENVAYLLENNSKYSLGGNYLLSTKAGHSSSECPGCITIGGTTHHVECMGVGGGCSYASSVNLSSSDGKTYTAVTLNAYDLTSEDFFLMPDRSLFVGMNEKEEIWMNIPEQLAFRDSITNLFTFTGIFFTNYPVYKNQ